MIVWLVWEFAESPGDLRALLRAYVAGSWVLAILTLANFSSPEAIAAGQYPLCRLRPGSQRCSPFSRPRLSAGGTALE